MSLIEYLVQWEVTSTCPEELEFSIPFYHTCIFLKSFQEAFPNVVFVEGCVQAAYVTFGSFFHSYVLVLIWPSTNALSLVTPQCMTVRTLES